MFGSSHHVEYLLEDHSSLLQKQQVVPRYKIIFTKMEIEDNRRNFQHKLLLIRLKKLLLET